MQETCHRREVKLFNWFMQKATTGGYHSYMWTELVGNRAQKLEVWKVRQ